MIPDKDEKVYFNVDLTEPDEVYELTGYQESKIKVKFLKFLTRGQSECWTPNGTKSNSHLLVIQ